MDKEHFLEVAKQIGAKSLCTRAKVGAVLVKDNIIVSSGFNTPPIRFITGGLDCTFWCKRSTQQPDSSCGYGLDCPTVHAEAYCIIRANQDELRDSTLYVTDSPCADCAKLIAASGIAKVVLLTNQVATHRPDCKDFLNSCGVQVFY